MTQIFEAPSNPAPLFDSVRRPVSNSGVPVRAAGLMLIAACLLTIVLNPAHADEINTGSAPVAEDKLPIDDEESDNADDGSHALRDTFKVYDLQEIEPISAKEEEALLGNWGDTDAEDGD